MMVFLVADIRSAEDEGVGHRLSPIQWCHYLDFEASGVPAEQRLAMLHDTIEQALLRVKLPSERAELEWAHADCHRQIAALQSACLREGEVDAGKPFQRLARVAAHYESFLERLNRRYWWLLCLLGLGVVSWAIICGPEPDCACLDLVALVH